MPSPVGHSLSGLIAYLVVAGRKKWSFWILFSFIFLSNLPDLDFLPGWLIGQPNIFHRGMSHSLFMALVIGLSAGIFIKVRRRGKFVPVLTTVCILYAVHVLLDLFSADHSPTPGFQILWPFSDDHYIAPSAIFTNITRSSVVGEFIPSLFNYHNLRAIVNEMIVFLPPLLLLGVLRMKLKPDRERWEKIYKQPEV